MRNGSGDRSYSITAQLSKRFSNGTELSGAYTYTDAKDRMSMGRDLSSLNALSTPVDGSLEHRELRTSFWERPHKVTLVATTDLPARLPVGPYLLRHLRRRVYLRCAGRPQRGRLSAVRRPIERHRVRAEGRRRHLLGRGPADYPALDRLIRNQSCLRNQRGRLMERNSCRDPWVHETAASLSKRFRLADRRTFEVTADLFNVLSFLDSDWGRIRQTPTEVAGNVPLLDLVGYDVPNAPRRVRVGSESRRARSMWRRRAGGWSSASRSASSGTQSSGSSKASNGGYPRSGASSRSS